MCDTARTWLPRVCLCWYAGPLGCFFFLLSLFPPLKSYFLLRFSSIKYSPQPLDCLSGPWKDIQTSTLFLVYSFLYMLRGQNYCKFDLIENSVLTLGWSIWCQSLCCDLFLTTHTSNTSSSLLFLHVLYGLQLGLNCPRVRIFTPRCIEPNKDVQPSYIVR